MLIKKSFYFVRHGETEYNLRNICVSSLTDPALTAHGKYQAQKTAQILNSEKLGSVFSSPLQRAKDTAYLVSGKHPKIIEELREWDLGDFDGQPVSLFLNHIKSIQFEERLPNGESKKEFFHRSIDAINTILRQDENPLIVAHGATYWAILYALNFPNERINNCQCFLFKYLNDWQKIAMRFSKVQTK